MWNYYITLDFVNCKLVNVFSKLQVIVILNSSLTLLTVKLVYSFNFMHDHLLDLEIYMCKISKLLLIIFY